ncbi:MAG: hypothetical protein ABW104_02705 [Candidatus Thiodiazotropha sp. 6PLUC2]
MNNLETYSHATKKQCDYFRQKIERHTPPKSNTDERMIGIYKRLLIRDRSYLHNLELLKIKETLRTEALNILPNMPDKIPECSSSLDLDEFKLLLDENLESI